MIIPGVAGIIPTAIPLPARITPPHGLALKRHAPAQFRRDLRTEALLTSSDSEDDGDSAGYVVTHSTSEPAAARTSMRAGSSKEVGSAHSLVPDPRLRISTSKVTFPECNHLAFLEHIFTRALVRHGVAIIWL